MSTQTSIPYRQMFPWLQLLRAVGLAFSIRQLIVALAAVIALGIGHHVINWLTQANPKDDKDKAAVVQETLQTPPAVEVRLRLLGATHYDLSSDQMAAALRPWEDLVRSVVTALNPENTSGTRWLAAVRALLGVAVGSFFGLILCRLAARQITTNEEGSFRKSIQFGVTRFEHAFTAPLIPWGAALVLVMIAILMSSPGRLPYIGTMSLTLVSPIVYISSLIAAFLILATVISWPLMIVAVAYDDCDGFGGLSRSYSMWTGRGWHFVWYWLVIVFVGAVSMFLIGWLESIMHKVASFALGSASESAEFPKWLAQCVFGSLISAYGVSYFWTGATLIYALLRQMVDGVPPTVVAPDDDERLPRETLPVVGIPAMHPREEFQ